MTRRSQRPTFVVLTLLILLAGGCGANPTVAPSATTTAPPTSAATPSGQSATASPRATGSATPGVHTCPFVPGSPVASMPDAVVNPPPPTPRPTADLPTTSKVAAAVTNGQLGVMTNLAKAVTDRYVDPNLNGRDWPTIVARYRMLVEAGLRDDDFYVAMGLLVEELGDGHSRFESPDAKRAADQELAGRNDFVGTGGLYLPIPGAERVVVILTLPGSPAERAGLQPHDSILAIDGEPVFDSKGTSPLTRMRGPAGTLVTFTVQRPGEAAHDLTITRARVAGALPIGSCLIPGTHVGYIFLPSLFDETFPEQIRVALRAMTADEPLAGLILDNRLNGGGSSRILAPILGLFLDGDVGALENRTASRRLVVEGEDVGGSQNVPLIVLVGRDTVSYGEIMTGVLQAAGRALVVGETSLGNVEVLSAFDFADGSRAWLAHETFISDIATYGPWEDTGIRPDVTAPTRWDLFTEANDPALAAALQELGVR